MIVHACWVITTGEAGMRSQALGLAEAVGLPIVEKQITPRGKLRSALERLWPRGATPPGLRQDGLAPPWPRLAIACGGGSVDPTLMVKQLSGGRTFAVYVQNPQGARARFDLVVAMPHDGIAGPNVVQIGTALHRVTAESLGEARERWRNRLVPGAKSILGVLVGGDVSIGRDNGGGYRLTEAVTAQLIRLLRSAHVERGMSAAITPSRRTSRAVKQAITEALAAGAFGTLWDGTGENPYLGILGLAERLVVTGDSISMVSEALATGRPVHVLPLKGHGKRQHAFLTRMAEERRISIIEGDDLDWNFGGCSPVDPRTKIAAYIRRMLAAAGTAPI